MSLLSFEALKMMKIDYRGNSKAKRDKEHKNVTILIQNSYIGRFVLGRFKETIMTPNTETGHIKIWVLNYPPMLIPR